MAEMKFSTSSSDTKEFNGKKAENWKKKQKKN